MTPWNWIKTKFKTLSPSGQVGIVIGFLALAGVCLIFRHALLENFEVILAWMVSGVLASLVASYVVMRFSEAKWEIAAEQLTNELKTVNANLKKMDEKVDQSINHYKGLLEDLPDALGGKFTKSLFAYYPKTSKSIAEILSEQTSELYLRHCDRVVVINAVDYYQLGGKETVPVDGGNYNVWRLRFDCRWTWRNDSEVSRLPLEDFVLALFAPDVALQTFMRGVQAIDREKKKDELDRFRQRKNYLRTIVPHPDSKQTKNRLSDDDIEKLWKLDHFELKIDEQPILVQPADMELLPPSELPISAYRVYRFAKALREKPLEKGHDLVVKYSGELALPIGSQESGTIYFPPSDVIAKGYEMNMLYSPNIVSINKEESGCFLVEEKIGHFADYEQGSIQFPPEFVAGISDKITQLSVPKYSLTDLHRIYLVWNGKQPAIATPK